MTSKFLTTKFHISYKGPHDIFVYQNTFKVQNGRFSYFQTKWIVCIFSIPEEARRQHISYLLHLYNDVLLVTRRMWLFEHVL